MILPPLVFPDRVKYSATALLGHHQISNLGQDKRALPATNTLAYFTIVPVTRKSFTELKCGGFSVFVTRTNGLAYYKKP